MRYSLFCGQSSYPRTDTATANRYRALAEMTALCGYDVIFLNRHPVLNVNEDNLSDSQFKFINISGNYRNPSWFRRQLARFISTLKEFICIVKLKKINPVSYINVYSQYASDLVFYYIVSKFVRAECIIHVVEYRSHVINRSFTLRINDLIFETLAPFLFSKFIAISTHIKDIILQKNPKANIIIIPPVCRFEKISNIEKVTRSSKYFIYCASLAYEDVAWFVIEAFIVANLPNVELVLVLNGNLTERIRLACEKNKSIILLEKLEYKTLIGLYKGAHALLIPLRNITQDVARYPQKITEYLASGRPIISCNVGEVGKHFTHGVNAFLSDNYDIFEYAKMLALSIETTTEVEIIAQQGYSLGKNIFDISSQKKNLLSLLT